MHLEIPPWSQSFQQRPVFLFNLFRVSVEGEVRPDLPWVFKGDVHTCAEHPGPAFITSNLLSGLSCYSMELQRPQSAAESLCYA